VSRNGNGGWSKLRTKAELNAHNAQLIARLVLDEGLDLSRPRPHEAVGSSRDLRGIPAVGRGVSGAMFGSDPLGELLRREEQAERRLGR
jgi:hypothetical protein